jgi:hypothetical protein
LTLAGRFAGRIDGHNSVEAGIFLESFPYDERAAIALEDELEIARLFDWALLVIPNDLNNHFKMN